MHAHADHVYPCSQKHRIRATYTRDSVHACVQCVQQNGLLSPWLFADISYMTFTALLQMNYKFVAAAAPALVLLMCMHTYHRRVKYWQ